jgi:outer membrane protein assembly factor BamB
MAASPASAADWPRFRGPDGSGVTDDKAVPTSWSAADKPAWNFRIPGGGNSSPVVVGDDVLVTYHRDEGKFRCVACVNAADGKVKWTAEEPAEGHRTHKKGSQASPSPAADAGLVVIGFVSGADNTVAAFDRATGKRLWRKVVGQFHCTHGYGASPILAEGMVIVANDTGGAIDENGNKDGGESFVIALDAKSGETKWKTARTTGRAVFSTPLVAKGKGGAETLVLSSQADGVTAYELKTGKKLWSCAAGKQRSVGSPFVAGDLVIATWGQGSGGGSMTAVRPDAESDDKRIAWTAQKALPYVPTSLFYGGHIYMVSDTGVASCVNPADGAIVWSKRLEGNFAASLICVAGRIVAVNEAGDVFSFDATADEPLRKLAKSSVGEGVFATPAAAGGRLLIRTHGGLVCYAGK